MPLSFRIIFLYCYLFLVLCLPALTESLNEVSILAKFINNPKEITELKNSSFILRSSLLGVAKVRISGLKNISRKVLLDGEEEGEKEIILGTAYLKLSRGLNLNSKSRLVKASVSAQKENGKIKLFRIRFTKERHAGRVFEITHYFKSNRSSLRHINLRALTGKSCGSTAQMSTALYDLTASPKKSAALRTAAASTYKTFTIATDCDRECYLALGQSSANDRIAEFFNSVRVYYNNDFAYDFLLTSQTARKDSTAYGTSTNYASILNKFLNVSPGLPSADLKHLITGKEVTSNDPNERVVGYSYLKVICLNPEYTLGFSQHFNSLLTPIIIAHELGHNFGAVHDDKESSEQGIMTKILTSPYPSSFSTASKVIINAHIDGLGAKACYDYGSGGETDSGSPPAISYDSELSAKFSRNKFTASISQPAGTNCLLELHAAGIQSNLFSASSLITTASLGSFSVTKLTASNLKKVLLANSSKQARPYFAVKSICTEGVGYSAATRINVGVVNSSKINKSRTVRSLKTWLSQLKASFQ